MTIQTFRKGRRRTGQRALIGVPGVQSPGVFESRITQDAPTGTSLLILKPVYDRYPYVWEDSVPNNSPIGTTIGYVRTNKTS